MNAKELVRQFADTTASCIELLQANFLALDKQSLWAGAVLIPRDGSEPLRRGRLGSLGNFQVHGRGCRFELDSGDLLDVDWDDQGTAVFDTWRILIFARSRGEEGVSRFDLRVAAASDEMLRPVKDDWFTWADSRYNISRS